jgi:hypothetical protein
MKTSVLLLLLLAGVCSVSRAGEHAQGTADLSGHYVREAESDDGEAYEVTIEQHGAKADVSFEFAHPDGHGAVSASGVLTFTFEDSFSDKGTGTLRRKANKLLLSMKAVTVEEPRCLQFFGDDIVLSKAPAEKKE